MTFHPLDNIPTEWLEQCLTAIALDPATAQPSTGQPIRRHVVENHRLVCGNCRNDWHKVDSDQSWCGVCANCGSDRLTVESEPVPGAPSTGEWELACNHCEATWVGLPGDPCSWCKEAAERQIQYQIDLLLTPPDVDPADALYETRMAAWLQRMKVGTEAGMITRRQAETAYRRVAA